MQHTGSRPHHLAVAAEALGGPWGTYSSARRHICGGALTGKPREGERTEELQERVGQVVPAEAEDHIE